MKTTQPDNQLSSVIPTQANSTSVRRQGVAGVFLLALLALNVAGCRTSPYATSTGSATASITIGNRTLPQVALATDAVFLSNGFTGGRTSPSDFTFTHPGKYGSQPTLGGALEKFNERVVVTLKPYGDTVTVTCNARWVEDPNQTGVGSPQKAWGADAKPYQELLAEIEARLK
jgi:hypothetical protein